MLYYTVLYRTLLHKYEAGLRQGPRFYDPAVPKVVNPKP